MDTTLLIGKENSGKSMLTAGLTGKTPQSANFRGSTVACETYCEGRHCLVDSPGILLRSDSQTTQAALAELQAQERVLLVAKANNIDEDLKDLLPLVAGKKGAIALTFWDKVQDISAERDVLPRLSAAIGVPIVPVDARKMGAEERERLLNALENAAPFKAEAPQFQVGWDIEPPRSPFDWPVFGPFFALVLLLLPATLAVWGANSFAAWMEPAVKGLIEPLLPRSGSMPLVLTELLSGNYGFLTMGPLMFVWAVPTVVLYAILLGIYKASGLAERITAALHHLVRPLGLSGRDLLRLMMGFGCNVPAVISTRACSACTRDTTIAAIAFGSACSYQFGATLAVFAAAGKPWLIWPFLALLIASTIIYARLLSPREARSAQNQLVIERRNFIEWPSVKSIWREVRLTLTQFFGTALPIFFLITLVASGLNSLGALNAVSSLLTPVMAIFRLPADAALPVVLASIRKDGILLLAQPKLANSLTPIQLLTSVYLAGALLPCLVTAITIARERGPRSAVFLMARQAGVTVVVTLLLSWLGTLIA